MIYSANRNQWIADPGSIAISDAKNLTPLAVRHYPGDLEEVTLSFQRYKNHFSIEYLRLSYIANRLESIFINYTLTRFNSRSLNLYKNV